MNVDITIVDVGGTTGRTILTTSPEQAGAFLHRYDHEGSSIALTVKSDTNHEAYDILEVLTRMAKPLKRRKK